MEKNQLTQQKESIQEKIRHLYEMSNEIISDIKVLKRSLHVDEQIIDNVKSQTIMCVATIPIVSKPEHKEFINEYLNKNFLFDDLCRISSSLPGTLNTEDVTFCEVDLLSENLAVKICD